MLITRRNVPADPGTGAQAGIDYQGIATLSAGVVAILVGLDQGAVDGYGSPAITVASLVVGVLLPVPSWWWSAVRGRGHSSPPT